MKHRFKRCEARYQGFTNVVGSKARKTDSIRHHHHHHHHHHPEEVVCRNFCLNSGTVAVSKVPSRRWWCIECLLPEAHRPGLPRSSSSGRTSGSSTTSRSAPSVRAPRATHTHTHTFDTCASTCQIVIWGSDYNFSNLNFGTIMLETLIEIIFLNSSFSSLSSY